MSPQTVSDVLERLDSVAPFSKAAGWDPVGLQFGDPAAAAAEIAVCHEVTEPVVDAAIQHGVDLLISYHPLLFDPPKRLLPGRSPSGRAFRLITAGVALGVVHTAYDVAPGGTADALATALRLEDVRGFAPLWSTATVKIVTFLPEPAVAGVTEAMAGAGAGHIGNYSGCSYRGQGTGTFFAGTGTDPEAGSAGEFNEKPELRVEMVAPQSATDSVVAALVGAHPYEEPAYDVIDMRGNAGFVGRVGACSEPTTLGDVAELVRGALGGVARIAGGSDWPVERIAAVPGSGSSFIPEAAAVADLLVTGDVTHHRARLALDSGLAVIDPGHRATERPGVAALYAATRDATGEALDLVDLDPGPWEEA